MRKVWLLEEGDVRQVGDMCFCANRWMEAGNIGIPIGPDSFVYIREIDNTSGNATEEKLAAIEDRLRYVENELQANKDLRQDDLVTKTKYRNPVMPDDYGKRCQFADDVCFETRCEGILCGYVGSDDKPYICNDGIRWAYARIEVTA